MDGMCNKPVVNRGSSLDNLLGVSNSWVKDFSKKIFYSDLKLSEKDLNNLYLGAEMMVYCYKDMKRASEDAYAFEHPLAINDLLLDAYNGIYREKRSSGVISHKISPPADFIGCYRDNYLKIAHTSFFHDIIELKLIDDDRDLSAKFISSFYNGLKMDGDDISSYVSMMSLPKDADNYVINLCLDKLEMYPAPFFVKIGDAMNNSETRGSDRQFGKMTNHYNEMIKRRFRALYPYFYRNICNNYMDKIIKIPENRELSKGIVGCLAVEFDRNKANKNHSKSLKKAIKS